MQRKKAGIIGTAVVQGILDQDFLEIQERHDYEIAEETIMPRQA